MDYDVIVIGSGFGGSIAANRLASAGLKALVLERGPWRDSLPVRSMGIAERAPFPYGRTALTHLLRTIQTRRRRLTLNKRGLFEVFAYRGLGILAASAVGGGSHVWGASLDKPVDPNYWRNRHSELNPASVEKYYPKVVNDLGAVQLPQDYWHPNAMRALMPAALGNENRCRPAEPMLSAIKYPATQAEAGKIVEEQSGIQRRNCAFDADSFLGSPGGAKASVDFVYLAPVLNKGATVRDMCEVAKITRTANGDGNEYAVHFTNLRDKKEEIVKAKRIVIAAGTMNTLRILFVSSIDRDGLRPMPSLGRTFGANCDLFGAWLRKTADPSMLDSPPLVGRFEVDGDDKPFVGIGGFPGIGSLPLPAFVKRKVAKTGLAFGMGVDSGRGAVKYDGKRLQVDYDQEHYPAYGKIREAFRALGSDSGAKVWTIPRPITAHQWGGACVGSDDSMGVIDHRGEVYGNPGIFVADAAALPAAVGGPPSLTIAAWAHHVAEGLAQSFRNTPA